MTGPSQAFAKGQIVDVIGPAFANIRDYNGETGEISDISVRGNFRVNGLWYPASSLRLVEPAPKIGDWVQVIGPSRWDDDSDKGKIFKIDQLAQGYSEFPDAWSSGKISQNYPAKSLRKLTPGEVESHLCHQKGKFTTEERLDSLEEYTRENDTRLAVIEKRQAQHRIAFNALSERTEKRLTSLEASQKGAMRCPLDEEKWIRTRREAWRLSVLREIASIARELFHGHDIDAPHLWQLFGELKNVEKQIAEGQ
jgi:hypothetical protein